MGDLGRVAAFLFPLAALGACAAREPNYAGLKMDARRADLHEQILLRTLTNGLRVVVLPDKRTNLVMVGVHYAVGSADDPRGDDGLAHYVEHVLFDAPYHGRDGDALRDVGLSTNAYTAPDRTFFYLQALDGELTQALEIAARRLETRCDDLDGPSIARERDVVVEEEKLRDSERSVAAAANMAIWGVDHPYARVGGGTGYADVSRPALCTFIDDHYGPASAVLVVAGNVADDELDRITLRFGRIPARPAASRAPYTGSIQTLRLVVHGLENPTAMLAFPVPAEGTKADAAVAALDRHVWQLVGDTPAVSATTYVVGGERDRAIVAVAEVADAKRLDQLVAAMRRTFAKPTFADFELSTQARRARLVAELDDPFHALDAIAAAVSRGERPSRFRDLRQLDLLGQHDALGLFDAPKLRVAYLLPEVGVEGKQHVTEVATSLHDVDVRRSPATDTQSPPQAVVQRPLALTEYQLRNGLRVLLAPDPQAVAVDVRLVITGTHDNSPAALDVSAAAFLHPDPSDVPVSTYRRLRWYASVAAPVLPLAGHRSTTFQIRGYSLFADWHVWHLAWTVLHGSYDDEVLRAVDKARTDKAHKRKEPPRLEEVVKARLAGHADAVEERIPSAKELAAFRNAHYRPDRSTLIVTGNFNVTAMRDEIDSLFGAWQAPRANAPAVAGSSPLLGAVGIQDDDARTVEIAMVFTSPDTTTAADAAARQVLGELLTLRLQQVRERMGASYVMQALNGAGGTWIVGAIEPAFAAQSAKVIDEELARIRRGDAAIAGDFERARKRVLADALAIPLGASRRADALEELVIKGWKREQLTQQVDAIRALDATAVQNLAARDLQPGSLITVVRGQRSAVEATLGALGVAKDKIHWTAPPNGKAPAAGDLPKWASN